MELEDSCKLHILKEIVQKNISRIREIEDIEQELALSRWLHDSFEKMSLEKPEFRDIFHREMYSLKKTIHQLESTYTENKLDIEKKRVLRQNFVIERFLINTFSIDINGLIGRKKPSTIREQLPAAQTAVAEKPIIPLPPPEAALETCTATATDAPLFPSFSRGRSPVEEHKLSKISIPIYMPPETCEKREEAEEKVSAEESTSAPEHTWVCKERYILPHKETEQAVDEAEEQLPVEESTSPPEQVRVSEERYLLPSGETEQVVEEEKAPEVPAQPEVQQMQKQEHIEMITSIEMPPDPALESQLEPVEEKPDEKVSGRKEEMRRHRRVEKLNLDLPSRRTKASLIESGA